MRQYLVDCGSLHLSVREHPGGSPAILALHGLASNARWWDLVAERLSPELRVVAPDLRGHGLSDKPRTGYSFADVVTDLRGLCDAAGLDRVIVAGHSWGASVALWFAATLPERTAGCVCVDGGVGSLRDHLPTWREAEERLRPPRLSELTEATVREWAANGPLADGGGPEAAGEILLGNFEPDGNGGLNPCLRLDHHMEIVRGLYELDAQDLLTRVMCPVLLVPARGGPWAVEMKARAIQRAQDALGPSVRATWVDGGHDLPVQRPAEVADAISGFARTLARGRRG